MADMVLRAKPIRGQVCTGSPRARFLVLVDGKEYEMFPFETTVRSGPFYARTGGGETGGAEISLTAALSVEAALAIVNSSS